MKITYEALMKRREEVAEQIKETKKNVLMLPGSYASILTDLRAQIKEIDSYVSKYYPEKVMSI